MGGKGDTTEQKIRATQDQLRLARITQDVGSMEDEPTNFQKLIKKVVETTRCTITEAETALFDTDYNVEEAVNAILEETYSNANIWKEQKSRKAKRHEAEERGDESAVAHRNNRSHSQRNASTFSGRGRGSERGRGGFRGGIRGGARGGYGGRGGYQPTSISHSGPSAANNVWDNSQAVKAEPLKEWSDANAATVDEIPEDTDWKTAGTLVFSRRDGTTPPAVTAVTSSTTGISSASASTMSAPISFAAVAAAGASKAKEKDSGAPAVPKISAANINNAGHANNPGSGVAAVSSQSAGQTPIENMNSLYQNSGVISTSNQLTSTAAVAAEDPESEEQEHETSPSVPPNSSMSSVLASTAAPVPIASGSAENSASTDWTTQLKNDLGIGAKAGTAAPMPLGSSGSLTNAALHRPLIPRSMAPMLVRQQQPQHHHHAAHTVEFVCGDSNGSAALPGYQFGFHLDANPAGDERTDDAYVSSKPRPTKHESNDLAVDSSSTLLSNGGVVDFSSPISSQQQAKGVTSNGTVGMVSAPAVHSSTGGMQRQSIASGLSYADTSSMSYPSSESRSSAAKPSISLHQQQQAQHQLYTATQIPYNSYPYLNMYSPVTGVRQDEAQYAAALVQYPFGMGQIDMSSLSTMLPPGALASQQQATQPPPPSVQSQHQQRPEQPASFVDLNKAYAAAAVANSSGSGGSASGILGGQQQRDSTAMNSSAVAPPPGFSGPPSNLPAAFTLPQHNHLSSLFQMPPAYHPQLNQLPFSFMLPNVTGNGQHKLGHQMFAQQTVEESLSDQRLSSQQPKVYGSAHQQLEKYGNSSAAKDRLAGGAQATPPPQIYQAQAPQPYLSQMQMHSHNKKYNGPQHWSAS